MGRSISNPDRLLIDASGYNGYTFDVEQRVCCYISFVNKENIQIQNIKCSIDDIHELQDSGTCHERLQCCRVFMVHTSCPNDHCHPSLPTLGYILEVWDEASMAKRHVIEAVDRTMQE
ncbi:hypothetical protein Tco_0951979 [Tanacetum coccineum]|uniref:Uncharacterized protein n=1 Tax=Tanacetum coccineum TaxID=301880 RepID=A0ABQ5DWN1_9ASTR